MRKVLSCVLMMTLLLAACAPAGGETPENAAAAIQAEYAEMAGCTATVDLTVDYGEKVFDFTVEASWQREGETVLTVTAPDLLSGITARIAEGETILEYDGAGLSLGALDGDGLTPISAVTALLKAAASGYAAQCSWVGEDDSQLQILCRDPETAAGAGTEFLLVFDRAAHTLLRAEVSSAGATVLTAQFSNFTFMEMTDHDTGNHADLG